MLTIRAEMVDVQFAFEEVPLGGTVGLLALATDANVENDLHRLLPSGVGLYTTRIPNADPITIETLGATSERITTAARMVLPGRNLDVLVYGSTSGTVVLGPGEIERRLREAKPRASVLTPVSAAETALHGLGVRKLSVLSPFVRPVSQLIADHFERAGFEITNVAGFELKRDLHMTRLPSWALVQAARQTCAPSADGLFIPGTSVRSTEVIEDIESVIGRPVVTSNQAIAWRLADVLGIRLPDNGLGQLVRAQHAETY
jgi:maleate isomerase